MTRTFRIANLVPLATAFAAVLVAVLALTAKPASAGPVGFQASGGWYTESEEMFLGAGLRLGAGTLTFVPNIEWVFVDTGSLYSLNLDGTMSILPLGVASGYVGAGVGWFMFDSDFVEAETEMVVNLIAGVGLNAIPLKPFGQFKWVVIEGDDPLVFSIGARF